MSWFEVEAEDEEVNAVNAEEVEMKVEFVSPVASRTMAMKMFGLPMAQQMATRLPLSHETDWLCGWACV